MIKKKVKAFSIGQMAENMMENGKMVNNTVLAFTLLRQEKPKKENGLKEKEHSGWSELYSQMLSDLVASFFEYRNKSA